MYKLTCISLALLFTISLVACSSDQNHVSKTNYTGGDEIIIAYNSLDELSEHKNTCTYLPENFIDYAPLQPFGEFVRYQPGYPRTGFYVLNDANGHEFSINVRYPCAGDIAYGDTLNMDNTMTDMRTHPAGISGTVYRDGIDYLYNFGNLVRIYWEIDDIGFSLSLNRRVGPYPLDGEVTPISRLLSTDMDIAYSVVEELAERLAQ